MTERNNKNTNRARVFTILSFTAILIGVIQFLYATETGLSLAKAMVLAIFSPVWGIFGFIFGLIAVSYDKPKRNVWTGLALAINSIVPILFYYIYFG